MLTNYNYPLHVSHVVPLSQDLSLVTNQNHNHDRERDNHKQLSS